MSTVKLANILFVPTETASACPELFYRSTGHISSAADGSFELAADTHYDFSTYFNTLSLGKWKRYTCVENIKLCLEVCGNFTLQLLAIGENDPSKVTCLGDSHSVQFNEFALFTVEIPRTDAPCLAFMLTTETSCSVRKGWYESTVAEEDLRPVFLSVVMTTYNNEKYLLPNIDLFNELLAADDPIAGALNIRIVDNGKTIAPAKYENERLFIHPNNNTGGAGGFTRGMVEILKNSPQTTHVLLMDDDVSISPESLKRTFALLRLRNKNYEALCINGAMLKLEHPSILHEDVGYLRSDGGYVVLKPQVDFSSLANVVANEAVPTEIPRVYGAWWYCCIPLSLIQEHGLPLPLFIRCDDVEYGMRLKPTIATMNGICAWHASFEGRFRASVDHYQYTRNFLIANAINKTTSEWFFMLRLKRRIAQELNTFAYTNAELLLDGLEDYLKGPDFIKLDRGAELMKTKGGRNEKLVPFCELEREIGQSIKTLYQPPGDCSTTEKDAPGSKLSRLLATFRFNPHKLADNRLSATPVVVTYDAQSFLDRKTQKSSQMVAINTIEKSGILRQMDRARYQKIMDRYHVLLRRFKKEKAVVAQAYRKALPELSSVAFWESYLDLNDIAPPAELV